jgi:hypothetical protein
MGEAQKEKPDSELHDLVELLVEERLRQELGSLDERIKRVLHAESEPLDVECLAERIEVSPFIQLESEFRTPILIRKSAIVGFKGCAPGTDIRDGIEISIPLSIIYTPRRDFVVCHRPDELLEALGQAEL